MKQKTMVLIALAVVCGLGASFMTSKLLADRQTAEETVKVLVAKKNLDVGIVINKPEEMFEEKEILKETAPKNVLTKFDEAKGRQLKIPRRAGDSITQDDLHDKNSIGLMGNLPPGHRAVGIRVSSEMIANGFAAVPHSRIDVAVIVKGNNAHDKNNGSRIILQNVLVLASGQATVREEQGKPMLCEVVTVALTPEEALKLETAKTMGTLSMMLRGFGDSAPAISRLVTQDDVTRTAKNGTNSEAEEDKPGKSISPSGPGELSIPLDVVKQAQPVFQPINEKMTLRITNRGEGGSSVVYVFEKDAEGQYQSRIADANSAVIQTPPARSANPSGTAAPPAPEQKR